MFIEITKTHRPKKTIIIFFIFSFMFLNSFSGRVYGSSPIRFVSIEGNVTVLNSSGVSQAVKVGQILEINQKVITGPQGRARLLLPDRTIIDLKPKTEMTVAKLLKDSKTRDTSIEISKGDLRSSITEKLKKGEKLQIKTPVANFSVRGTDFNVQVSESTDESVKLNVFDGRVEGTRTKTIKTTPYLTQQNQVTEFSKVDPITRTLTLKEALSLFEQSRIEDANVLQSLIIDQDRSSRNLGFSSLQSAYQLKGDLMKIPSSATRVPNIILPAGTATSPYNLNFQTLTIQTEIK